MKDIEKYYYEIAAREIAEKNLVLSIFSKAFSDADGDEKKAVARYIQIRAVELISEHLKSEQNATELEKIKLDEDAQIEARKSKRQCCWTCVHFESTSWLDKTKGYCEKHMRNTFADQICEIHQWRKL